MKSLVRLTNNELIEIINIERARIKILEKRIEKLDKIWRDYYRRKAYRKEVIK